MRIASPCRVGWEQMMGDERVRFCRECSLHVYNIAEMTRAEAESLIAHAEGRMCARLYRRADGTVATRDCPVGLRALRRSVARLAGAALTAILSLCTVVVGQKQSGATGSCSSAIALKIKRTAVKNGASSFAGLVLDPAGAVVADAQVRLIDELAKRELTAATNAEGEFIFASLSAGRYTFEVEGAGFKLYKQKRVIVNASEAVQVNVVLQVDGGWVMGIFADAPPLESSNGTTIFREKTIQSLPIPE